MNNDTLSALRREYGESVLDELTMPASPIPQFHEWFDEACQREQDDPSAMVISTVDALGRPDARVVLLKGVVEDRFIFYTNYESVKAEEIRGNKYVSLTFYWPAWVRQVRIRGEISRVDTAMSDAYFASRPYESQLAATISKQSQIVPSRATLEKAYQDALKKHGEHAKVLRPEHWGGYQVLPYEFEFWQGRNNRLHDRVQYMRVGDVWQKARLSP